MRPNPQETPDLVTFTEEILDGNLYFLFSVGSVGQTLTWMVWLVLVHKVSVLVHEIVALVKILTWVAWVHKFRHGSKSWHGSKTDSFMFHSFTFQVFHVCICFSTTHFTDTWTLGWWLLKTVHLCTKLAAGLAPGTFDFQAQVTNR